MSGNSGIGAGRRGSDWDDQRPRLIFSSLRRPEYTKETFEARIEGSVGLLVIIGPDGIPLDIKITASLHPDLDRKAIECLWVSRYHNPTGRSETMPVQINFCLP
jgi:outer membrane biosynthesis protein TonB